jgi:hypothetical protein
MFVVRVQALHLFMLIFTLFSFLFRIICCCCDVIGSWFEAVALMGMGGGVD